MLKKISTLTTSIPRIRLFLDHFIFSCQRRFPLWLLPFLVFFFSLTTSFFLRYHTRQTLEEFCIVETQCYWKSCFLYILIRNAQNFSLRFQVVLISGYNVPWETLFSIYIIFSGMFLTSLEKKYLKT